jgi:hypothetical protein
MENVDDEVYSEAAVVGLLRKAIGNGTAKQYSIHIGVTQQYLSDVLLRRRAPGPAILQALGLRGVYVEKSQILRME